MRRIAVAVFVVWIGGFLVGGHCGPPTPTPVEPPDTSDCPAACERLQELGCPEGEPLSDGTTCVEFCIETQQRGHALNPSCVRTITRCSELDILCGVLRRY